MKEIKKEKMKLTKEKPNKHYQLSASSFSLFCFSFFMLLSSYIALAITQ